jgi:hypothetical protein
MPNSPLDYIGRLMHFYNEFSQPQPWAAIVTSVGHFDKRGIPTQFNLTVFPPDYNGSPAAQQFSDVPLVRVGEAPPVKGCYCVPPPVSS